MPQFKSVVRGSSLQSIVDGLESDKSKRIALKQGEMAEFCGSTAEIYEIDGDKVYAKVGPRTGWFDKAEIDAMKLEWKSPEDASWMNQYRKMAKKEAQLADPKLNEVVAKNLLEYYLKVAPKSMTVREFGESVADFLEEVGTAGLTTIQVADQIKGQILPVEYEKVKLENHDEDLPADKYVKYDDLPVIPEPEQQFKKTAQQVVTLETQDTFKDYFLLNITVLNPGVLDLVQSALYDYLQQNAEKVEQIFAEGNKFTFKSKTIADLQNLMKAIRQVAGDEVKVQIREAQKKS